jgi:hypothetical protein
MPTLIGLHGRRGAGKDTAFGYAHEWATGRGLLARRRGFADALKLSFTRLFIPDCSVDEGVAWCDEIKDHLSRAFVTAEWTRGFEVKGETETTIRHKISGRLALQRFGTEGHRDVFGTDFWVDALLPTTTIIDEHDLPVGPKWPINFMSGLDQGDPDICVITDVRFPNEAERIKLLGGEVWEIYREGYKIDDSHASEIRLPSDLIDHTIRVASGDLRRLQQEVEMHMERVVG